MYYLFDNYNHITLQHLVLLFYT